MTTLPLEAVSDLARKALRTWMEEEAEAVLSAWLAANGPEPAVLQWRTLLLRALDRRSEAIPLLQPAASIAPNDGEIVHALAQVHLEAGLESSALFETALRMAPTRAEARLSLIAAYFAEGRGAEALTLLGGALARNPGWLEGHRQYAQLCTLLGRSDEALNPLLQAIDRFPDVLPLRIDALELLMAAGDYAGAVDLADQGLSRSGDLPELMVRKATALDELGQRDQAGALLAQCGEAQDAAHACRLIRHHLRQGSPEAVLRAAGPWLDRPEGTEVWPYVSLAWRMLGSDRVAWLEEQEGLVRIHDLAECGLEWSALADRLRHIHANSGQFSNKSVNGGTQTDGPLFARIEPEIMAARRAVVAALEQHVAGLPAADPGHPQLSLRRDRPIRFAGSWSVRLSGQGFHRYHHHPQGWFSAVLYVTVPDHLAGAEGQLALGGSPPELGLQLGPSRHVAPQTGRVVVFPSTMWHATKPFSDGERMSIAFDLARPPEEMQE